MKAEEVIKKYVNEEHQDSHKISILGLVEKDGEWFWWHIHRDEEIPDGEEMIVINLRRKAGEKL